MEPKAISPETNKESSGTARAMWVSSSFIDITDSQTLTITASLTTWAMISTALEFIEDAARGNAGKAIRVELDGMIVDVLTGTDISEKDKP